MIDFKTLTGRTVSLPTDSIESLKQGVAESLQIPAESLDFFHKGKQLENSAICDGAVVNVVFRARGGVMMEPTLQALARKYNCDKMVCRKCYARLPPRAKNCRKKMCGHSNQLRVKKKLK
eukprot:NODE_7110_length_505_cov_104.973684_g6674_i0.p1 GENE.NODE_7110_length_505_cov_104.973684_g6674_i0~~NODE_7110_length_505_cov_104.973684_g6674_i0.p1  ORF type:complete len:120 (-),score=25.38 NODE_7110_length_505_cov_104.973684_g6674_i0:73-432(-)